MTKSGRSKAKHEQDQKLLHHYDNELSNPMANIKEIMVEVEESQNKKSNQPKPKHTHKANNRYIVTNADGTIYYL